MFSLVAFFTVVFSLCYGDLAREFLTCEMCLEELIQLSDIFFQGLFLAFVFLYRKEYFKIGCNVFRICDFY